MSSLSSVCKCCTAGTLYTAMANSNELDISNWLLLEKVDSFCYCYDMLEAHSGRDLE